MQILFSLAAGIALISTASALELSLIRGPLENTGVDSNAVGSVQSNFTRNNPQLVVRLRSLTAGQAYQFTVDGVSQADFTAAANGGAGLRFRLRAPAGQALLDFDPRGHVLAVSDGTSDVLKMVYSGEEEPAAIAVDERTTLLPAIETMPGWVDARYLEQRNQDRFILHFHGITSGLYTVYVDGQPQSEFTQGHGRSTMVVYSANKRAGVKQPNHGNGKVNDRRPDLDFDPRGKVVDIVKDGTIVYSGVMLAQVNGINTEPPTMVSETLPLLNQLVDTNASAHATLLADSTSALSFEVSVANLPEGTYDVLVDGGVQGTIAVAADGTGSVAFAQTPAGTELALTFDPRGHTVAVAQGGTIFLSRLF